MKVKIKYKSELGMPDFETENTNSSVSSPMAIYLQCKDGKKRNADATLKETALTMLFATRGLLNTFNNDVESIEIDGIKGLQKVSVLQTNINGQGVTFHSRYKVANWKVSLGSIDEFYYLTHNSSDSDAGVLRYRETYAKQLRDYGVIGDYIKENDVISDISADNLRNKVFILKAALKSFKIKLDLGYENGSFYYMYNNYVIRTIEDADNYISNDADFTLFLFINLLFHSIKSYDRYDIFYIDATNMDVKTLNMFRVIAQILKNDKNNVDQNINLVYYNLTKSQLESIKSDKSCQVITLPNSRDAREQANLRKTVENKDK